MAKNKDSELVTRGILNDGLEAVLQGVQRMFDSFRLEIQAEIHALREEMKTEFGFVRDELKTRVSKLEAS